MIKRIILLPYKMGSASAKALQVKLKELSNYKVLRVKQTSRTYKQKPTDYLLYYGGTHVPFLEGLNTNRHLALNKITTLQVCTDANICTVPWTTDRNQACEWINAGKTVVARSTVSGHSGMGITVWNSDNPDLPLVPLYTQYVKKTYECRIHVFKGQVIDAQIKRKVRDTLETNPTIRNIHTGWVYCRENFTAPPEAINTAIAAVTAASLDFGAVDLIYNQYYNKFYVLEINTAPGLTGTTLTNYANIILEDITNGNN